MHQLKIRFTREYNIYNNNLSSGVLVREVHLPVPYRHDLHKQTERQAQLWTPRYIEASYRDDDAPHGFVSHLLNEQDDASQPSDNVN